MAIYAYIRVSKKDQEVGRQLDSIKSFNPNIHKNNIFIEHDSGKNNNRIEYHKLLKRLQPGDELVIHELDRISRNKDFLKEQLMFFKKNKIILRVLELPTTLQHFTGDTEWVGEMVNNIIIEVYSTMAQRELERISQRTKEGLEAARRRGRFGGHPNKEKESIELALSLYSKKYKIAEICKMTKISKACFYKYLRIKVNGLLKSGSDIKDIIENVGCTEEYIVSVKRSPSASYLNR